MPRVHTLAVVSDIHYASEAEQARGCDYGLRGLNNPVARFATKLLRDFVWLRNPLGQNHLLDSWMNRAGNPDWVIANGDYACDTDSVGLSDDAAFSSAKECLGKLRERFGPRLLAIAGDHEFGKISFAGTHGGMRINGYHRAMTELAIPRFWRIEIGRYVLIGLTSSLIALPVLEPDTLPEERAEWNSLRQSHLEEIRAAFDGLDPVQRVLLFCHDPTALPFLARDESIRRKLSQVEFTVIGHLHSALVLMKGRVLAGMPRIGFCGPSARRMSTALREARFWKPFHVRLCPSLAGIELLRDGGYLTIDLIDDASRPATIIRHRLPRR